MYISHTNIHITHTYVIYRNIHILHIHTSYILYIHTYNTYMYITHIHIHPHIKSLLWKRFCGIRTGCALPPRGCLQHFNSAILPRGIQSHYRMHPGQPFIVVVSIPIAFSCSFGVISHIMNAHFKERQRKEEKKECQTSKRPPRRRQIILTRLTKRNKKRGKTGRRRFIRASCPLLWVNILPCNNKEIKYKERIKQKITDLVGVW